MDAAPVVDPLLVEISKYGLLAVFVFFAFKWLVTRQDRMENEQRERIKAQEKRCDDERAARGARIQTVEDRQHAGIMDVLNKNAAAMQLYATAALTNAEAFRKLTEETGRVALDKKVA